MYVCIYLTPFCLSLSGAAGLHFVAARCSCAAAQLVRLDKDLVDADRQVGLVHRRAAAAQQPAPAAGWLCRTVTRRLPLVTHLLARGVCPSLAPSSIGGMYDV